MFKETAADAHMEAWRILLAAVGHLALFPKEVDAWVRDIAWKGVSLPMECVFYTYMNYTDGMLWYSNSQDDADFFILLIKCLCNRRYVLNDAVCFIGLCRNIFLFIMLVTLNRF